VQGFAVRGGRIVEIDLYADRERLGHLDLEIHRSPRTAGDDEEAAPTDRENLPPPR
jgi:hypothetical protein